MPLIEVKESKYDSDCAREACTQKTIKGKPYVYDTEEKKAYCSKECGEMDSGKKVIVPTGNGNPGGRRPVQQLWRTPEEAVTAIDAWEKIAMPKIESAIKTFGAKTLKEKMEVAKVYQEIFLGKFDGGSKS